MPDLPHRSRLVKQSYFIALSCCLSFLFVVLSTVNSYAQGSKVLSPSVVYTVKGDTFSGLLPSDFYKTTYIKLYINEYRFKSFSRTEIDSIKTFGNTYELKNLGNRRYVMRQLVDGVVDLYLVEGLEVAVRKNDDELIAYKPSKFDEIYEIYCTKDGVDSFDNLFINELTTKVAAFNNSSDHRSLYDSIKIQSKPLSYRISAFTPGVGLDLKLGNTWSLFNNAGLTLIGPKVEENPSVIRLELRSELRWFYGMKVKQDKGEITKFFSGPYFAPTASYFVVQDGRGDLAIGFIHGWQRTKLMKTTFRNISFGPAYLPERKDLFFLVHLEFGWVL